ncbi:hypothetical protein [Nocardia sp. BMG111209]|uniref:hypothetical protein n=1 Tax=Nocardia sp. BMG111209 TaxID=1160137 RepID=UPI0003769DB1|nr:hypothetical protein [Nocardia sp. BMG111209]
MTDSPHSASGELPADGGEHRHPAPAEGHQQTGPYASARPRPDLPGSVEHSQLSGAGAGQYGTLPPAGGAPVPASAAGGGAPIPPGGRVPAGPGGGAPIPGAGPGGGASIPSGAPGGGAPIHGAGQPVYGPPGSGPEQAGYPAGQYPPPGSYPPPGAYPTEPYPAGDYPPGSYPPAGEYRPGEYPPGGYPPGDYPPGGWAAAGAGATAPMYGRPAYGNEYGAGRALGYGWERFRANPIPWVAVTLVGFLAYLAVTLVIRVGNVQSLPALLLLFLIAAVVVWLLQAAMIRGALHETDGAPPDFQSFFGFVNAGNVLLTALLVFVLATIAAALCLLPALIVGFLCMFSLHFVIDQDLGPFDAIKASARLVIAHVGSLILLALAVALLTFLACLLCGVGLLVVGPITAIGVTYSYRVLSGGPVA